ncbi:hypothetical protein BDV29DRAFT_153918 [Aspergillus leporis]|uniref:Uncharacterized protein n=1 Tax=Aspergillus leporis TaxID=41062 RepID=A0A5N5XDG8_9EURO|nr:hypothetical protein BDV29DRAFT_153918 [Aspergillus leporis]
MTQGVKHRSLACGIYFACSSISAAIIPPVMRILLAERTGTSPIVQCIGAQKENPLSGNFSYGFLRKSLFWLIIFSNVPQTLSQ